MKQNVVLFNVSEWGLHPHDFVFIKGMNSLVILNDNTYRDGMRESFGQLNYFVLIFMILNPSFSRLKGKKAVFPILYPSNFNNVWHFIDTHTYMCKALSIPLYCFFYVSILF